MSATDEAQHELTPGEIDKTTGQPVEEAEKNLSRHATRDSSPPVDEQARTTSIPAGGDETAKTMSEKEQGGV